MACLHHHSKNTYPKHQSISATSTEVGIFLEHTTVRPPVCSTIHFLQSHPPPSTLVRPILIFGRIFPRQHVLTACGTLATRNTSVLTKITAAARTTNIERARGGARTHLQHALGIPAGSVQLPLHFPRFFPVRVRLLTFSSEEACRQGSTTKIKKTTINP